MKVNQFSTVIIISSLILHSSIALDVCKDTNNTNCQSCGDTDYPRDEFYRQNCMRSCGVCKDTNIALGKATVQSSTYRPDLSSSNAVDGTTWGNSSCTLTHIQVTSWWCVDLLQLYNVLSIKLYNRDTHKERLQKFEIRTSSISSDRCSHTGFTSATSCYKDTTSTVQDIYTIERCNQPSSTSTSISARTVYVKVSYQYLTLCEVQIFSDLAQCNTGYYSTSSSTCQPCNTCLGDTCDPSNGVCTGDCKTGFYGTRCQQNCNTCRDNSCDTTTGVCTGECKTGFYGTKCQKNCNDGCLNNQCSKSDGRCNDCKPDTVGPYCTLTCGTECQPITDQNATTCDRNGKCTKCITGRYGDRCDKNCSAGCDDGCDRNGRCTSCIMGRYGDRCDKNCSAGCDGGCDRNGRCTSCIMGRYGNGCDKNCSMGCDGGCDRGTGRCTCCIKGKTGDRCDINCNTYCTVCNQDNADSCTECIDGRWGSPCNKLCSSNCKTVVGTTVGKCNITSGVCSEGCKTGFYGIDCNNDCRSNCRDGLCDQMTGDCINGCVAGKIGSNCKTDCEAGSYGVNCSSRCGNCADETPCDIITGSCGLVGCADWFQGPTCHERLHVVYVTTGVICGILGMVAVFLTYNFCKKRSQSTQSDRKIFPGSVYNNKDSNRTDETLTTGYQKYSN